MLCATWNGSTVNGPSSTTSPAWISRRSVALEQARFLQLHADQPVRERRRVHGHVDLAQDVRQRAGVVLVAVRDEDRAQVLAVLDDVADVRDDEVDAEHVLGREHEAAVDGDDVVAVLEQHHVLADLAETAERDDAKRGICHTVLYRSRICCGSASARMRAAAGAGGSA